MAQYLFPSCQIPDESDLRVTSYVDLKLRERELLTYCWGQGGMAVDTPIIVAFAAVAGSIVGACSSVAATFIGHRLQARGARLAAELEEHQELYGKFVEEAVPLFVEAIQKSAIEPAKIIWLYSKVARIRLTSSDQVLRAAEEVGKRLLEFYERPPEDPAEILARVAKGEESLDPLRDFTEACRRERAMALQHG